MNKPCRDKFQVLTLALSAETAAELKAVPAGHRFDAQREALTELWASDAAKDAAVDRVRCAFAVAAEEPAPAAEEPARQRWLTAFR